jgi:hypothetical protein
MPDPRAEQFQASQVFDLDKEEANRVINDLYSQLEMHISAGNNPLGVPSTKQNGIQEGYKQTFAYLRLQLGVENWNDV